MKDVQTFDHSVFFGSSILTTELIKTPSDCYKDTCIIVYKIYLPEYIHLVQDFKTFLDTQEHERADKYYKETDKNRFIICRSLLKFALAHHTQSNINSISIELHPNKKPYVPNLPNTFFNISHSCDYALLAISTNPIGIDIEYINLNYAFLEALPYIFNEDEIRFINNSAYKTKAFYSLWTRKEAFVKALGKGIDEDFSKIPCLDGHYHLDASLTNGTKHWQVHNFKIGNDDYLGAIATPINNISDGEQLHFHAFPHTIEQLEKRKF